MAGSLQSTKKALAANVQRLREGRHLSQERLAELADIDRTYVSQIERAIGNPSLRIICQIADALKCSAVNLIETHR